MKKIVLLSLAATFMVAGQAHATDAKNRYLILGPGSFKCGDVLADLAEGKKRNSEAAVIVYSNWLAGSLTAYNRDIKNTYSVLGEMNFKDAFQWTIDYCTQNPTAIYSRAVDALISDVKDDRYVAYPDVQE